MLTRSVWNAVRDGDVQSAQRVRRLVERELRAQQREEPRAHAQDRGPARARDLRRPVPAREHQLLCVSLHSARAYPVKAAF